MIIHPTANSGDLRKLKKLSQDMIFNIGNRTGKGRMKPDGSLREAIVSKGFVIFTAEYPFDNISESTTSRLLHVEFEKGSVDLDILTDCQNNTTSLNNTMACYIEWLIINNDKLTANLQQKFEYLRSELANKVNFETNKKLIEICIFMLISLEYVMQYFTEISVIDANFSENAINQLKSDLLALIEKQSATIAEISPTSQFTDVVANLLSDKTIYTEPIKGDSETSGRTSVG